MADYGGPTNDERIKRRLRAMTAATAPLIERELRAALGEDWLATARRQTEKDYLRLEDSSGLLNVVLWAWEGVFAARYPEEVRRLAILVRGIRNRVGHDEDFGDADTAQLLARIETLEALLRGQAPPPPPPPRFALPARAPRGPSVVPHGGDHPRRRMATPAIGRPDSGSGCALLAVAALALVVCAGLGMLFVASRATAGATADSAARATPAPTATRVAGTPTTAVRECFPQTGLCAEGAFLAAWRATGGLPRHGVPLTGEREEVLADGRWYTVQYFERSRLERPSTAVGAVQTGTLGRQLHGLDPPGQQAPGARYFPATGHNVAGRFLAYWEANGAEAGLGLPLGEERRERLEDGREYTVQYFERARLELHPESAAPGDVQLGQLGRLALAR